MKHNQTFFIHSHNQTGYENLQVIILFSINKDSEPLKHDAIVPSF